MCGIDAVKLQIETSEPMCYYRWRHTSCNLRHSFTIRPIFCSLIQFLATNSLVVVVAHVHNSLSAMAIGSVLPIELDMELQQQQWCEVTNVDIQNDDDQGEEVDELITISYKFHKRKQTATGDVNPKWTSK